MFPNLQNESKDTKCTNVQGDTTYTNAPTSTVKGFVAYGIGGGRQTIFTDEEEYIEKEKSPRDAYDGIGSAPSTCVTGTGTTPPSETGSFDDTASRITDIGNQMSRALKALSIKAAASARFAKPDHASRVQGYGRRNRRRGRY